MVTWWCSPRAIRPSADSGSPCDPVLISTTCSGGIDVASSSDTISPGATRSSPRSRATPMLRTIERPTKAHLRPCISAASSTCWMRCTWLAKLETISRCVARRRLLGDGQRGGDRVVDVDELAVERPGDVVVTGADLDQHRIDPVLAQLGADQGEGEPGADQRDVPAQPQQVGHGADVVLVPVGQDDGDDVTEAVLEDAEVGQDQVDAGLLGLREEHPAVDDQQLALELEHGHVPADLAEAAEGHDPESALGQPRGCLHVEVQLDDAHDRLIPAFLTGQPLRLPGRRAAAPPARWWRRLVVGAPYQPTAPARAAPP